MASFNFNPDRILLGVMLMPGPKAIRKNVYALTLGLGALWCLTSCQSSLGTPANQKIPSQSILISTFNAELLEERIIEQTNIARKQHGLSSLRHSLKLTKAATWHSQDMVKFQFFSHSSPVEGRESMTDRLSLAGIKNTRMAENIITGFMIQYEAGKSVYLPEQTGSGFRYRMQDSDVPPHTYLSLSKSLVSRWMRSPGHRANILNPVLQYIGVGSAVFQDSEFGNMPTITVTQNLSGK